MTGEYPPKQGPLSARSRCKNKSQDLLFGTNEIDKFSTKSPEQSPTNLKSVRVNQKSKHTFTLVIWCLRLCILVHYAELKRHRLSKLLNCSKLTYI